MGDVYFELDSSVIFWPFRSTFTFILMNVTDTIVSPLLGIGIIAI